MAWLGYHTPHKTRISAERQAETGTLRQQTGSGTQLPYLTPWWKWNRIRKDNVPKIIKDNKHLLDVEHNQER